MIYGGRVDRLDLRTQQTQHDPIRRSLHRERRSHDLDAAARLLAARSARPVLRAPAPLPHARTGAAHWTADQPRPHAARIPACPPNLDAADRGAATAARGRAAASSMRSPPRASPMRDLWVGTDDGLVWRTRDEGARWQRHHAVGRSRRGRKVGDHRHLTATTRRRRTSRSTAIGSTTSGRYVYRTHDGGHAGLRWSAASPHDNAVNVVREDPVRAACSTRAPRRGVYVSFDDGEHWQTAADEPARDLGARHRRARTTTS